MQLRRHIQKSEPLGTYNAPNNGVTMANFIALGNGIRAIAKDEGQREERAAYLINRILDWNLVPVTILRKSSHVGAWPDEIYSFQHIIEKADTYDVFDGKMSLEAHREWELMEIFDFIIQNGDRHDENWLVTEDGNKIWAIDHGRMCYDDLDSVDPWWADRTKKKLKNLSKNKVEDIKRLAKVMEGNSTTAKVLKQLLTESAYKRVLQCAKMLVN